MSAYDRNNIFARILRGEAPCRKVHEDAFALAFHDIHPKGEYVSFVDFTETAPAEMQAGFWRAVAMVARQLGVADGFRIASHVGPSGGQPSRARSVRADNHSFGLDGRTARLSWLGRPRASTRRISCCRRDSGTGSEGS